MPSVTFQRRHIMQIQWETVNRRSLYLLANWHNCSYVMRKEAVVNHDIQGLTCYKTILRCLLCA